MYLYFKAYKVKNTLEPFILTYFIHILAAIGRY